MVNFTKLCAPSKKALGLAKKSINFITNFQLCWTQYLGTGFYNLHQMQFAKIDFSFCSHAKVRGKCWWNWPLVVKLLHSHANLEITVKKIEEIPLDGGNLFWQEQLFPASFSRFQLHSLFRYLSVWLRWKYPNKKSFKRRDTFSDHMEQVYEFCFSIYGIRFLKYPRTTSIRIFFVMLLCLKFYFS